MNFNYCNQITITFLLFLCCFLPSETKGQDVKITLNHHDVPIKTILEDIEKQIEKTFFFEDYLINLQEKASISIKDADLKTVIERLFNKKITYLLVDKHIVLQKVGEEASATAATDPATTATLATGTTAATATGTTTPPISGDTPSSSGVQGILQTVYTVRGRVVDETGEPLTGATVMVKGNTKKISITDYDGKFELKEVDLNATLVVSFIGYESLEITADAGKEMAVKMTSSSTSLEDVVVTGYFDRTRQSFTGAEVSVKGEELRQLGALNLLTAISVFDPAVRPVINNDFGSDPNRIPEIMIRGENSFDLRGLADDSQSNPNAPLYILDGIEVSATTVYDLDMNRIDAFTILKDAAATALYGSRGANGVVLITSIRPRSGELRVTVNTNFNVSTPDLRAYNLMNAAEKLEFERRTERIHTSTSNNKEEQMVLDVNYNNLLAEVARGVDTYWLSQPLQTSLNQRYNIFLEGGDQHIRYGAELKYDGDKGVMKGSGRDRYGIRVNLNYNVSDKLRFYNDLNVDEVTGKDSPYGSFSQYALLNPYERVYDPETGEMIRMFTTNGFNIVNPLYDGMLPNRSLNRYTEIRDNLTFEWRIDPHLQIKGLAALSKSIGKVERYRSPESSEFFNETDLNRKGSYTVSNSTRLNLNGNVRVMYNNVFADKFTVSAGAGAEVSTSESNAEGFSAIGFVNDKLTNPAFAHQLRENSQTGSFNRERLASFFVNVNVGYENRFFLDATFRTDGSSKFGRNSRFAPFWSLGGAWNMDKEAWWRGEGYMKLRASVGSTGTTNFSSDQAITRFIYATDSEYNGAYGAVLSQFGNPNLRWQSTLQYNAGVDMSIWKNIIVWNLDVYLKRTQNLLLSVDIAPSTGFTNYRENMGSLDNSGVEARLRFNLIRERGRELFWSVTLGVAHNKNVIRKLSTAMKKMNEEALNAANSVGDNVLRLYEEGRSQSALMVVRSNGIDPMTGQEIYVNRDGTLTFEYNPQQKVIVGDMNPKLQGNAQSNLSWKGFNLFASFSFEYGAQTFNSTLASKVEGANPRNNADKRVLYDRWYRPGDETFFRDIRLQTSVYQTSRLVQDDNFIRLSNLSLTYDVPRAYIARSFMERLKATLSTSDVFHISTVKQERGTSYPFARSFSVGLSITF